jgi:multicomponent Na+:H+ antiporter subunit E
MKMRNRRIFVYQTAALFAVWLLLSQTLNSFYVGIGLLASVTVAWLNSGHEQSVAGAGMRLIQTALYFPWLLFKVLQSGMHMSYLILHPRLPIDPKLIRYQTKLKQPLGIVMLGNSITLTPGTITAEVGPDELLIHAMDDASTGDLTSFGMEQKIAGTFGVTR